jgi:hypothetical protein
MNPFVFLGGTVGNSTWRTAFTERLIATGVPADLIFNPTVRSWNAEVQEREDAAKRSSDYLLFYICDPQEAGDSASTYAIVEAVMHLYDAPSATVAVFDLKGLEGHVLKALTKTEKDLRARFPDGHIYATADEAIAFFASKVMKAGGN